MSQEQDPPETDPEEAETLTVRCNDGTCYVTSLNGRKIYRVIDSSGKQTPYARIVSMDACALIRNDSLRRVNRILDTTSKELRAIFDSSIMVALRIVQDSEYRANQFTSQSLLRERVSTQIGGLAKYARFLSLETTRVSRLVDDLWWENVDRSEEVADERHLDRIRRQGRIVIQGGQEN